AGPPDPTIECTVAHACGGGAAGGPDPSPVPIAVPVPPVLRVVGEAIVTLRAHAGQATDGLTARAEPVGEVILRARQLDQMDPAHGRRVQRDAERAHVPPGVDHA